MESNGLALGDTITAVINERRARLKIVGIGAAPDYLFEEAGGGMANDERSFGILWAPSQLVTYATGMRGAFNDVAIGLRSDAREAEVIVAVDSLLARYGGRGAIGRKDQLSNRVVNNELQQLGVMGMAFPMFFVAVAAFLAGTVLTRLIATEREQIAVLKAFGYTNGAVRGTISHTRRSRLGWASQWVSCSESGSVNDSRVCTPMSCASPDCTFGSIGSR
jgi:ABC-type transport system, involved in lipoprotein release, permease component